LCSQCGVMTAIKDCIKSDAQRQGETDQKELQKKEAEKKEKRQKWIVTGIVAMIVLIGNALLYFFAPIPRAEIFAPRSHPMAVAVTMDAAIKEYARDNGGRVPDTLDQLYGKYIPVQILSPSISARFNYKKASDRDYELIFRTSDNQRMPDIRFTQGRITP
jgi:hypothetical protein